MPPSAHRARSDNERYALCRSLAFFGNVRQREGRNVRSTAQIEARLETLLAGSFLELLPKMVEFAGLVTSRVGQPGELLGCWLVLWGQRQQKLGPGYRDRQKAVESV